MGLRDRLSRLLTVGGAPAPRPTPWPELEGACWNCLTDAVPIRTIVITGEGLSGAIEVHFCDACATAYAENADMGVTDTRPDRERGTAGRRDVEGIDESLIGGGARPPTGKATTVEVDVEGGGDEP